MGKLIGASRDELLVSHCRLEFALACIAKRDTIDEGSELADFAHDNMINAARRVLKDPEVLSD